MGRWERGVDVNIVYCELTTLLVMVLLIRPSTTSSTFCTMDTEYD